MLMMPGPACSYSGQGETNPTRPGRRRRFRIAGGPSAASCSKGAFTTSPALLINIESARIGGGSFEPLRILAGSFEVGSVIGLQPGGRRDAARVARRAPDLVDLPEGAGFCDAADAGGDAL